MKQHQRLINFLFLLNGLACVFTMCPYTAIKAGTVLSTSSPKVLKSTTISGFSSSSRGISFAGTITFKDACATGKKKNIMSLTIEPSGTKKEILSFILDCDTYKIKMDGDWGRHSYESDQMFSSEALGPLTILLTIDLETNRFNAEVQTDEASFTQNDGSTITQTWTFDSTTKINLCAGKDSASPQACTVVTDFNLFDVFFAPTYPYGYGTMATAELSSFYTLTDGPSTSLANSYDTAKSGYFGDKASSPTTGTSPIWDSSNKFVKMTTAGQYLSFPVPTLKPSIPTTSASITVAAWIKISSIATPKATIFSLHKSDGTEIAFKLQVDQTSEYLQLITANDQKSGPKITLDTWQLVGFSVSVRSDKKLVGGTIFVDSQSSPTVNFNTLTSEIDLSTASILRINGATNSFIGDVFGLRIGSPAGGFVKQSVCSSSNSLELGLGPFPLLCAADYKLHIQGNECFEKCPAGTTEVTSTPYPLCTGNASSGSESEKKGLSGGLVVAIVLSSIAVLILVILSLRHAYKDDKSCIGFFGAFGRKRKDHEKVYMQAAISPPISPIATEGPMETEGQGEIVAP